MWDEALPQIGQTKAAIELFEYEIRRYFGLGYIASFFKGTNAYHAQQTVKQNIALLPSSWLREAKISCSITRNGDFRNTDQHHIYGWIKKQAFLKNALWNILTFGWLGNILSQVKETFKYLLYFRVCYDTKISLKRIISYLPLLSCCYYADENGKAHINPTILEDLIHAILSPMLLIEQTLFFIRETLFRIFDIGSTKNEKCHGLLNCCKFGITLIYVVFLTPIKIIGAITDVPYQILKHFVYNPIVFIFSSIRQAFSDMQKFSMDKAQLDVVEPLLRKAVDQRQELSHKKMTFALGIHSKSKSSVAKLHSKCAHELTNYIFSFLPEVDTASEAEEKDNNGPIDIKPLSASLVLFQTTIPHIIEKLHRVARIQNHATLTEKQKIERVLSIPGFLP
jgi:hypothetical protein